VRHARYEILPDDGTYYGDIPELPGVGANADTLEGCRQELQRVLEGWIALGLRLNPPIPTIDGITLVFEKVG